MLEIIYYKNGQVHYETPYQNGLRHGIEKIYYDNGELAWEVSYQNNLRHGTEKVWFLGGQLYREDMFQNNQLHGVSKILDGNSFKKEYFIHGNRTSREEYRKYILIERLADLK